MERTHRGDLAGLFDWGQMYMYMYVEHSLDKKGCVASFIQWRNVSNETIFEVKVARIYILMRGIL